MAVTHTITSKQQAYLTSLLAEREHTDTGKTITVGEQRFRATADNLEALSSRVASRMIEALQSAPRTVEGEKARSEARAEKARKEREARIIARDSIQGPHFRKNKDLGWVVLHPEAEWAAGDVVEVPTAAGGLKKVKLVKRHDMRNSRTGEQSTAFTYTTRIESAQERAARPATPAQRDYLTRLLINHGHAYGVAEGQYLMLSSYTMRYPTQAEIAQMSAAQVSGMIDALRSDEM